MKLWALGLIAVLGTPQCALASEDVLPGASGSTVGAHTSARCAAMGTGFMPVEGSDVCVRISGHIRVGVGVNAHGPAYGGGPPDVQPSSVDEGATGTLSLDSPTGQGHIYLKTANPPANRWLFNAQ
jgi:hypothetical protein